MREYALPSAAGHKITVTSAATSLQELIRTAIGGSSQFQIPSQCDAFEIDVESGTDLRILTDGNTPTTSNGNLIVVGEKQTHEGINLGQVKLIRSGSSDTVCNIRIGQSGDDAKTTSTRPRSGSSLAGAAHTGTTATVGDSASSVTLLAANSARTGAAIRNDSSARLYIEQGATAATTSVDYLDTGDVYELPVLAGGEVYRGVITGIWASDAGGSAYVRENV